MTTSFKVSHDINSKYCKDIIDVKHNTITDALYFTSDTGKIFEQTAVCLYDQWT